jgi:hypothetical protein
VARRLGEGAVLVHLASNRIFELNATGARTWELLAAGGTLATITAGLAEEFAADVTEIRRDVEGLVAALEREAFVLS